MSVVVVSRWQARPGQETALLAGALTPLVLGRRRSTLTETERSAFALSLIALSQIALAIPVGLGLALGRYLFLPRMFIFVMVPRAVLIGLGFWLLASGVICDLDLEQFLTAKRRALLDLVEAETLGAETPNDDTLQLTCALARQCFINEYVYALAQDELAQPERLREALVDGGDSLTAAPQRPAGEYAAHVHPRRR